MMVFRFGVLLISICQFMTFVEVEASEQSTGVGVASQNQNNVVQSPEVSKDAGVPETKTGPEPGDSREQANVTPNVSAGGDQVDIAKPVNIATTTDKKEVSNAADIEGLKADIIKELKEEMKRELQSNASSNVPSKNSQEKKEEPAKIYDDNFKSICEFQDKLIEDLKDMREKFSGFDSFNKLYTNLQDMKITVQSEEKSFKDKKTLEECNSAFDEVIKLIPEAEKVLAESKAVLQSVDAVIKRNGGMIEQVKTLFSHNVPLDSETIAYILNDSLVKEHVNASESERKAVSDLVELVKKTSSTYGGKPAIPSYFVFCVFDCLARQLKEIQKEVGSLTKEFERKTVAVLGNCKSATEDIAGVQTLESTPKSSVDYIDSLKNIVSGTVDKVTDHLIKECTEVLKNAIYLNSVALEKLASAIEVERDQKIFEKVN